MFKFKNKEISDTISESMALVYVMGDLQPHLFAMRACSLFMTL